MKRLSAPLGAPIPEGMTHGVSVSLPTYDSVVGYEEKRPDVIAALEQGYPRFVTPAATEALRKRMQDVYGDDDHYAIALPSRVVAQECAEFIGVGAVHADASGVYVLTAPKRFAGNIKEFTQHSGQIISSRAAEAMIQQRPGRLPAAMAATKRTIIERIASFTNKDAAKPIHTDDIFLFATGMASIYTAHRMITSERPGAVTIQLGFPYVDTLKIQQKCNPGGDGLYVPYHGADDIDKVEALLRTRDVCAVFCEITANPLLNTVDLKRLHKVLRQYNAALVVDNTVGSWQDTDVSAYADITVTSLTKSFVGNAGAMGGALTLHADAVNYSEYRTWLRDHYEDLLYDDDAVILEQGSRDCAERTRIVNKNAASLARYLKTHPAVKDVRYPLFYDIDAYNAIKKPDGGYGALLSVILHDPQHAYDMHDALDVLKGPSLGTSFTLASLYTLMAHYDELAWAEQSGVPAHLIRVAVGTENDLIERFRTALDNTALTSTQGAPL